MLPRTHFTRRGRNFHPRKVFRQDLLPLRQFHSYRSDEENLGHDLVFLILLTKISPATREMPEWKPGLKENITENAIDICIFN